MPTLSDRDLLQIYHAVKRGEAPPDALGDLQEDEASRLNAIVERGIPGDERGRPFSAEEFTDKPDNSGILSALDWLPTAGGAVGGMLGAMGGGGIGSVPAAIGLATAGGAAGEGVRQLGRRIINAPAPATMASAAGDMLKEGAIQGASEVAGAGIGAGLRRMGPRLMQSALKPTQAVIREYRTTAPQVVQTLLDEGVSVTRGGLDKLTRLLSDTNTQIDTAIAGAKGTIAPSDVAARLGDTKAAMLEQVAPQSDLAMIDTVGQQFMNHPKFQVGTPVDPVTRAMTVPEAQALKKGTYRQLKGKYGEMKGAEIEAQKSLARGLKEEIVNQAPEVAGLNARDSSLMAADEAVFQRLRTAGNRDPVGFAWVTKNPTTFLAALADRSPVFKSLLARGLYALAGVESGMSPQLIRVAVKSLATSQDEEE